jgi:antitoxin component of RelBE/YafQ-DinJ toxin-antitoxin module
MTKLAHQLPNLVIEVTIFGSFIRHVHFLAISNEYLLTTYRIPFKLSPLNQGKATMPKEVQMSIKMESELRDEFMAAAATMHRPAAQIVRDLMRGFLARQETPNTKTISAMQAADNGEDLYHAKDADDLFRQLGI